MEVEKAKETADNIEKQYLQAAEERDTAITELEEVKRRNAELEKKLEQALAVPNHFTHVPWNITLPSILCTYLQNVYVQIHTSIKFIFTSNYTI